MCLSLGYHERWLFLLLQTGKLTLPNNVCPCIPFKIAATGRSIWISSLPGGSRLNSFPHAVVTIKIIFYQPTVGIGRKLLLTPTPMAFPEHPVVLGQSSFSSEYWHIEKGVKHISSYAAALIKNGLLWLLF